MTRRHAPPKAQESRPCQGPENPEQPDITDDQAARQFEGMVVRAAEIARSRAKKAGRRVELRDLIQAGWVGFFQGKRRWNPSRGVTLGAYCSIWVRGAISRELWYAKRQWEDSFDLYGCIKVKNQPLSNHHQAMADYLDTIPDSPRDVVEDAWLRLMPADEIALERGMLVGDVVGILKECLDWIQNEVA